MQLIHYVFCAILDINGNFMPFFFNNTDPQMMDMHIITSF